MNAQLEQPELFGETLHITLRIMIIFILQIRPG